MQKLIDGFRRFRSDVLPRKRDFLASLAEGQHPQFLFITCSDSRVCPHDLTQTEAGDLFHLRNIGNILPPHGWGQTEAEAVVEYAVAVLGVSHVIVCGHSHCGAMKALLHPEQLRELPTVAAWLSHAEPTRQVMQQKYAGLHGHDLLNAAIRANVLVQLEHLRSYPVVASRLTDGRLELHGWVYEIESGRIEAYQPTTEQFVVLDEAYQLPTVVA
jgi:carbonic anhydrase